MSTIPRLLLLRDVIRNKKQRDLWYHAELLTTKKRPPKGIYAYGSLYHKVLETDDGFQIRGELLPKETPVYPYGFRVGERMNTAHGCWVFKHQIPGVDLRDGSSIEELIFSSKAPVFRGSKTIDRSRKNKLRVRCGKGFYRIVVLNVKTGANFYIFGTNIKLHRSKYNVPMWMRRRTIVFPHPAKTTRKKVSNKFGFTLEIGVAREGPVKIGGIEMLCLKIGRLCEILFEGKKYYAHPSVMFPIN